MFDVVTLQGGPLEPSFDQAGQQMWENAVVDCTVQGQSATEQVSFRWWRGTVGGNGERLPMTARNAK